MVLRMLLRKSLRHLRGIGGIDWQLALERKIPIHRVFVPIDLFSLSNLHTVPEEKIILAQMKKKAIIIGAGPAGLTAAYELLKRTDIIPVILEKSGDIGGISKTINYKGNRMDMGPHRFFSKSDRVMNWWLNIMPLQQTDEKSCTITYQNKTREITPGKIHPGLSDANYAAKNSGKTKDPDNVMIVIKRLTRIYFLRKFFAYPIQLSLDTLRTLGPRRTIRILLSFLWVRLFPRKPEKSLEDFIINKFGKQLYLLFFRDYTEKVWGVPCHEIPAEKKRSEEHT